VVKADAPIDTKAYDPASFGLISHIKHCKMQAGTLSMVSSKHLFNSISPKAEKAPFELTPSFLLTLYASEIGRKRNIVMSTSLANTFQLAFPYWS